MATKSLAMPDIDAMRVHMDAFLECTSYDVETPGDVPDPEPIPSDELDPMLPTKLADG